MNDAAVRAAALDLMNRGGCSVPLLGGECVKRGILPREMTIGSIYAECRIVLDAMANEGKCQKWPDHYCYTLPAGTPVEDKPTDHHRKRQSALEKK